MKTRVKDTMIQDQLLAIINSYNSDDYYKYGRIPSKKLESAVQHYPVDPDDTPLALIDSTVFGSAKTGMVVGLKGIYWKNSWTVKTDRNFLSWEELAESNAEISQTAHDIQLIPGCAFGMSGSSMKKDLVVNLLNQIITLYQKIIQPGEMYKKDGQAGNNSNQDIHLLSSSQSRSSADLYAELVPEIMALCMAADGEVEDSEVEIATAIIDHDEFIKDKPSALSSLLSNIENMISDKQKSNAIFKLKATTVISKISKITDDLQKERLDIILDGMRDSVGAKGVSETISMIDAIKGKLHGRNFP